MSNESENTSNGNNNELDYVECSILDIITERKRSKFSCDTESIIEDASSKDIKRDEVVITLNNLVEKSVIKSKVYAGRNTFSIQTDASNQTANLNNNEDFTESNESFIDRKLLEILMQNMKEEIISELKNTWKPPVCYQPSYENLWANKDPVIDLYEKRIDFLQEEIRVKNNLIHDLVANAFNSSKDTKSHSETSCNLQHSNQEKFTIPKKTAAYREIKKYPIQEQFIHPNRYDALRYTQSEGDDVPNKRYQDGIDNNRINNDEHRSTPKRQEKKVVQILGDSIIKELKGNRLSTDETRVIIKSFPGATTNCMYDYVKPSKKFKVDAVVIHTGTNDLRKEEDPEEIAKNIINLAKNMYSDTTSVIVSGIVGRNDQLQEKVDLANRTLESECRSRNIGFINNDNIDPASDLNRSKLHLNKRGTSKLAINFKNLIKKL